MKEKKYQINMDKFCSKNLVTIDMFDLNDDYNKPIEQEDETYIADSAVMEAILWYINLLKNKYHKTQNIKYLNKIVNLLPITFKGINEIKISDNKLRKE